MKAEKQGGFDLQERNFLERLCDFHHRTLGIPLTNEVAMVYLTVIIMSLFFCFLSPNK